MSIDEKIGWWVTGLPYITPDKTHVESFKRSYIIPPSSDKNRKAKKFLREDIAAKLTECGNPQLSSYFIAYSSANIREDIFNMQQTVLPKINGEDVYLTDISDISNTDALYKKIEETIRQKVLPRKLAREDIFSKDDGMTAPPLQNTSSRKGEFTIIGETNFAGFNTLYLEYKKFMENFDILLKQYRGDPSKHSITKTYAMCILFAFSSTLFSFFRSELVLLKKNLMKTYAGLLLLILRFLQFCVGLFNLILSGREIGRYISDFFMPTDKSATGFVKALWNSVQSLSSFTLSCLSDLAFLCMVHTYVYDIDSSIDGGLRPDLPVGPFFPQNIRYILGTLQGAAGTMWNATKGIASIVSPYAMGRVVRDTYNGVRFTGWYLTNGAVRLVRNLWDKVKSRLNVNKERFAIRGMEYLISSLESIVKDGIDKAADDLQMSLQSCKSRFQTAAAILKAPAVMIALGSLLGGLIGPGVFAGLFGYIAGIFAGLGVAASPIALAVSVPLMVWMLECLLKLWGTICNFFFYQSCAHKNCADISPENTADPINEIERKMCMQKCWDNGVAGITSISIPFHVLTEMNAILTAANFPYTSSVIEGMRMVDASTQGTWREYLLGKAKTYAYDPAARKVRDFILNDLEKTSYYIFMENYYLSMEYGNLSQKEIDDIFLQLNHGALQPTSENIEKLRYIENKLTNEPPIIPATQIVLLETSTLTLFKEIFEKQNPKESFDMFIHALQNQKEKMNQIHTIYTFMDKIGESIQKNEEWVPETYPNFSKEFNDRVENIAVMIEKIKSGDSNAKQEFVNNLQSEYSFFEARRNDHKKRIQDRINQLDAITLSPKQSNFTTDSATIKKEREELERTLNELEKIEKMEEDVYSKNGGIGHEIVQTMEPHISNVQFAGSFHKATDAYYLRAPDGTTIKINRRDFLGMDKFQETDYFKKFGEDENNISTFHFLNYFKEKIKSNDYIPSRDEIKFIESTTREAFKTSYFTKEEACTTSIIDLVEKSKTPSNPHPTIDAFENYIKNLNNDLNIIACADFIAESLQKKKIKISEELDVPDEKLERMLEGNRQLNENLHPFLSLLKEKRGDPKLNTYLEMVIQDDLMAKAAFLIHMKDEYQYKIQSENRTSWNPACWIGLSNAICDTTTNQEKKHIRKLEEMQYELTQKIELLNEHCSLLPENANVFDEIKIKLETPFNKQHVPKNHNINEVYINQFDKDIAKCIYNKMKFDISDKLMYLVNHQGDIEKEKQDLDNNLRDLIENRNILMNHGLEELVAHMNMRKKNAQSSSPKIDPDVISEIKKFEIGIDYDTLQMVDQLKKEILAKDHPIPLNSVELTGKPILALYEEYMKKHSDANFIEFAEDMKRTIEDLTILIPIEDAENTASIGTIPNKEEQVSSLFVKMNEDDKKLVKFLNQKAATVNGIAEKIKNEAPTETNQDEIENVLKKDEIDTMIFSNERMKTMGVIADNIEIMGEKVYSTKDKYKNARSKYIDDQMKYKHFQAKSETMGMNSAFKLTGDDKKDEEYLEDAVNKIYEKLATPASVSGKAGVSSSSNSPNVREEISAISGSPVLTLYDEFIKKNPQSNYVEFANALHQSIDGFMQKNEQNIEKIKSKYQNSKDQDVRNLLQSMEKDMEELNGKLKERKDKFDSLADQIKKGETEEVVKNSMASYLKEDLDETQKYIKKRQGELNVFATNLESYCEQEGSCPYDKKTGEFENLVKEYTNTAIDYQRILGMSELVNSENQYFLSNDKDEASRIIQKKVDDIFSKLAN